MLRLVSKDPAGAELAEQAAEGLELLARCLELEGFESLAKRRRQDIERLYRVEVASTEDALLISASLDELANRYERIGRPEIASEWRWRSQRTRDRARERYYSQQLA